MTRQIVSKSGGEFYVQGNDVRRAPVKTKYDDNTEGHTMGYIVCTCNDYVDGAAKEIAAALNAAYSTTIEEISERMTGTSVYPGKGTMTGLAYVGLKLNGEAGEFAEKLGKVVRDTAITFDDRCSSIMPDRRDGMLAELGDVIWYVNEAARALGSTLRDVMMSNVRKVEDRRARNMTNGNGDNR